METEAHPVYRFGEFQLAPEDHRLSLDGQEIHLRPKTFQVLRRLVERHGHLVTREELFEAVWPETHVDETVLSRSIWEIREALRKDGDAAGFIQTVPKVGYQFVGPVRATGDAESEHAGAADPVPRRRARGMLLAAGLAVVGGAAGLAWWLDHRTPETPTLQAVPLTTDPEMENWPTFSPDGSRVAYQGPAGEGDLAAVFVKRIGESTSLRRTSDPGLDHALSWSPDGRWIAFLRGEFPARGPLRLMLIPPLAGAEREIARINYTVGWGARPAWTPDSRALIVPDREGSAVPYSLYRIPIDDGRRTRWTFPDEGAAGEGDKDPAVSPDGTRLAFQRNGVLHLVDLDNRLQPTGRPRQLVDLIDLAGAGELGGPWGLAWTADSRELVFPAGIWPDPRLFRVSAEGGPVRPLAALASGIFAPALSRAGDRLAYMEWIVRADIWQVEVDEQGDVVSGPSRLIPSSRLDSNPVLSPDGELIAFHSNRTGRYGIWIASYSGAGARPLLPRCGDEEPPIPDRDFSWSPDQGSIVFASAGDLFVADVASGTCRALTTGPAVDGTPVWSNDGWVYFSSQVDGVRQVWRVPAVGGAGEPVTKNGGGLLAVSPDGSRIYHARDGRLWSIPANGGEAREVGGSPVKEILDAGGRAATDHVAATEGGLFLARNREKNLIEYLDLASGSSKPVAEHDDWVLGLSASPDGRHLVYGLFDTGRADLMLVEGFE